MRILTWNCQGAFRKKAERILSFEPDIAVIQECESPETLDFPSQVKQPQQALWFGDDPNKGLGVFAYRDWELQTAPCYDLPIRHCVPVQVNTQNPFNLVAVWTKGPGEQDPQGYIGHALQATIAYEIFFSECDT